MLDAMLPYLVSYYGNPHSRTHAYGWETEAAVEKARQVNTEYIKEYFLLFWDNSSYHHHHHHHHQIFDENAGTGVTTTSVGPLSGSWLAARMAALTPDLQVHACLS